VNGIWAPRWVSIRNRSCATDEIGEIVGNYRCNERRVWEFRFPSIAGNLEANRQVQGRDIPELRIVDESVTNLRSPNDYRRLLTGGITCAFWIIRSGGPGFNRARGATTMARLASESSSSPGGFCEIRLQVASDGTVRFGTFRDGAFVHSVELESDVRAIRLTDEGEIQGLDRSREVVQHGIQELNFRRTSD
jgi:hypothetical protein